MKRSNIILAMAGSFILLSLFLNSQFGGYWLWFTAFVGFNLFQSAFTGFCPAEKIMKALNIGTT